MKNVLKKSTAALLAVLMVMTVFSGLVSFALGTCTMYASYSDTSLKAGETFTVTCGVKDIVGAQGGGVNTGHWQFNFDANVFNYEGVSITDTTNMTVAELSINTATAGRILAVFTEQNSPKNPIHDENEFVLTFSIKAGATPAAYDFRFSRGTAANLTVDAGTTNKTITSTYLTNVYNSIDPSGVKTVHTNITVESLADPTISAFSINGVAGTVSGTTITVPLIAGTNLATAKATFTNSDGSSVVINSATVASGATVNLSGSPTIACTQSGVTKDYTLVVQQITPTFALSVNQATKLCTLTVSGLAANAGDYSYQVWSDEGAWTLVSAYSQAASIAAGTATFTWTSNVIQDIYTIQVRIRDSVAAYPFTKKFSGQDVGFVRINNMTVNGVVPTGTLFKQSGEALEFAVNASKATANANDLEYTFYVNGTLLQAKSTNNSADYTTLARPGLYIVKAIVNQAGTPGNFDTIEQIISVYKSDAVIPELTGMTVPSNIKANTPVNLTINGSVANVGTINYSFVIGESSRSVSTFTKFSADSLNTKSYAFPYPGVYEVRAGIKNAGDPSYADTAIQLVTVGRTSGAAVQIGNVSVTKDSVPVTDFSSVTKGETVVISAAQNSNYEYSFWRLDARGNRIVKEWSSEAGASSLTWNPQQAGNYVIQLRARDKAFAGTNAPYEDIAAFGFNIQGATQAISNVQINTAGNTKKAPVTITATATAADQTSLLYAFDVKTDVAGTSAIQAYSADNTATWIPSKAGTYTIIVRVRNADSFGYYDVMQTATVTIN